MVTAAPSSQPAAGAPRPSRFKNAALFKAASQFFFAAIVIVLADAAYLIPREHRLPNYLALAAAALAIIALAMSGVVESRGRDPAAGGAIAEAWCTFGVFVATFALYAISACSPIDATPYDAHVRQAVAFIHGHTFIQGAYYIEHATVGGFTYQLHPPMPAFLLMPLALIWGMNVDQTAVSIILGAFDVALAWRMLRHFRLTLGARVWLTVFFGAGTIIWYETVNGSSWAFTMVVAIMFTLAALDEIFGDARPLLVGIFAGAAALTRYDLAPVWPIYMLLVLLKHRNWRELIGFAPGFAAAAIVFVWFNEVRYHRLFDMGNFMLAAETHQYPLGWHYFPGNFYTLFFCGPIVNGTFPYIHPRFTGQSILLTSPAFVIALRPRCRREVALIALAALLAIIPSLFYFTSGFSQYGTRHYLHAFPFLLVLMAFGTRRADQLLKVLTVISVILIAFGVWHVKVWGLAGP
jgi:hypothetical protein